MSNNCKSPEMCLLSEACAPCAICPNAKEKANGRLALTACSRSLTPESDAGWERYIETGLEEEIMFVAQKLEREGNQLRAEIRELIRWGGFNDLNHAERLEVLISQENIVIE